MIWIEALSLGALLVSAATISLCWRLLAGLTAVENAVTSAEARGRELARRLETLTRLREGQRLAEQVIESGTRLTRSLHHGISRIPFSILENIAPTAPAAKTVRQVHDAISADVYSAISNLNRNVGRQLRGDADGVDSKTSMQPESSDPEGDDSGKT